MQAYGLIMTDKIFMILAMQILYDTLYCVDYESVLTKNYQIKRRQSQIIAK